MNMPYLEEPQFSESAFFKMTPDLACIASKEGYFKQVNPAVIDKLGFTEEELMSKPIECFMHPEDRELTLQKRADLLNGKVLINFQNRYLKKTGGFVWLEWTSIYFADREIVFAIAKDVTEKKQIEKEVEEKYRKFKSLATRFKSRIEDDRKYLAEELHEELAQLVSVLKLDIDWMKVNMPDLSDPAKNKIEHAAVISELLINTIRRISFSISPNMLEDLGLNATLEWHCNEFSILNGIPCHFESSCDETDLSHEIKVDFFRICQEALTNVMYHALAKNVSIKLEELDDRICLTIEDDGKGFLMNEENRGPGLTRMQERAASINGHLDIHSDIGKGTRVSVTIISP
jgi:PAS domain S-box-containing protein